MNDHETRAASTPTRRNASAPKGRPTPGRKERNAAARAQARRHRMVVRLWWGGAALVVIGLFVLLVATGVGAGSGSHSIR